MSQVRLDTRNSMILQVHASGLIKTYLWLIQLRTLIEFLGRQNVDIGFLKSAELDAKSNSNWPIFASSSWRTMEADIDADSYDDDDNPLTNAGKLVNIQCYAFGRTVLID